MGFLYKILVLFDNFSPKRGGGLGRVKKSLQKKTEVAKKGGGGVSVFVLLKVKKKRF